MASAPMAKAPIARTPTLAAPTASRRTARRSLKVGVASDLVIAAITSVGVQIYVTGQAAASSEYPAERTVRIGSASTYWFSALRRRPMWTSTVRAST